MNVRPISQGNPQTAPPRFDRKFIEDHQLVERYLENKLPLKGARDLENWCRANPDYLTELKLSERAQTSLKLLEASGRLVDLQELQPPWWKTIHVLIGLTVVAFLSLVAFWALLGKYVLLRGELADTRTSMNQGSLVQPAISREVRVSPDRAPGVDHARIIVTRAAPQLMDVHIDLGYTDKLMEFRLFVDKKDQGRALILNDLLKDSNSELRMTLNSSGLSAGIYDVRIEALPCRESAAQAHENGAADQADHPHPRVEGVLQRKQTPRQYPADSRGAEGRQGARKKAQRGKFRGDALQHRAAAGAQGAKHGAFIAALVPCRLHRRQQHDDSRGQSEQKDILHGQRCAVHDAAYLLQNGIDVEHRDRRELTHQIGQRRPLYRGQIHAGHIRAGGAVQEPGRKYQKEIRPKAVPANLADAGHFHGQRFPRDIEAHLVAQFQLQGLLIFGRYGYQGLARIRARPPGPCDQLIVFHQAGRPGEVLFPFQEPACGIALQLDRLARPRIDRGNARTHHRKHGRLPQPARLQKFPQGLALLRADVDQKIVGHVRGQAVPPVGEQISAHHCQQQQHHQP